MAAFIVALVSLSRNHRNSMCGLGRVMCLREPMSKWFKHAGYSTDPVSEESRFLQLKPALFSFLRASVPGLTLEMPEILVVIT